MRLLRNFFYVDDKKTCLYVLWKHDFTRARVHVKPSNSLINKINKRIMSTKSVAKARDTFQRKQTQIFLLYPV
jgi:hypothetical protein